MKKNTSKYSRTDYKKDLSKSKKNNHLPKHFLGAVVGLGSAIYQGVQGDKANKQQMALAADQSKIQQDQFGKQMDLQKSQLDMQQEQFTKQQAFQESQVQAAKDEQLKQQLQMEQSCNHLVQQTR